MLRGRVGWGGQWVCLDMRWSLPEQTGCKALYPGHCTAVLCSLWYLGGENQDDDDYKYQNENNRDDLVGEQLTLISFQAERVFSRLHCYIGWDVNITTTHLYIIKVKYWQNPSYTLHNLSSSYTTCTTLINPKWCLLAGLHPSQPCFVCIYTSLSLPQSTRW